LEEVDVQAGEAVDARELGIGGPGREAIIADELADDGPVLLLDMGTVVLLPGAAAREGDPMEATIGQERAVDELGAVVAVEPDERQGPVRPDAVDGAADAGLAFAPDGLQLHPGGGDVHRAEGAEIEALGARPTVGDEIDFQEPGRASVHSAKVRMGISCVSTEPGRVRVAPRRG
jgi:hypothetical protein